MRKVRLGATALVVSVALLAGASAAQGASFTVLGIQKGEGHSTRNGFAFHEKLLQHGVHVGKVRIEVARVARRQFAVRALFRFHGGKIRAAGPVTNAHKQAVPITGGRGRYHGISGRVIAKEVGPGVDRFTFRFSR